MVAVRLQSEHAQEQERCAGCPGLGAASGGVLDRKLRQGSRVAGKCLGQAAIEELGRL